MRQRIARRRTGPAPFTIAFVVASVAIACTSSSARETSLSSVSKGKPASLAGRVVFVRSGSGDDGQSLFVMNVDGSDQQQLTQPGEVCCLARVSPDGTSILVMPGGDAGSPLTGGTIGIDGSGFERLPLQDATLNLVPQAWSPNGERIAFEGWDDSDPSRTGVYTARASDGGNLVRVTSRDGFEHDMPLDYSPDGTQLVFYRSIAVDPGPVDIGGSLWVVGVDGSDPHRISGDVFPDWWARWSPDGSTIVFASERLSPDGAIWTVRPDGSDLTKLFQGRTTRFPLQPTWSPDGAHLLVVLHRTNDHFQHVANGLYVIGSDGSDSQGILRDGTFKTIPEWVA